MEKDTIARLLDMQSLGEVGIHKRKGMTTCKFRMKLSKVTVQIDGMLMPTMAEAIQDLYARFSKEQANLLQLSKLCS